jgi:hypothetical protein
LEEPGCFVLASLEQEFVLVEHSDREVGVEADFESSLGKVRY